MNSERIPRQGDIYRHFKNELYQIVNVATHFKTGESYVVYQALFGDFRTYVRPLDMFIGAVDRQKYPSVKQKYIFEKVDRSDITKANLNNNSNYINNVNAQYSNITNSTNSNTQYSNNTNSINSNTQYNNVNPINSNTQHVNNNINPINSTNYINDIQYNNNNINSTANNANIDTDDDILINPLLIDFLELDTYRQKLEYFQSIIPKLDERLINDICIALDITCNSNSMDDTILHIKDYLQTQTRFKVSRY